MCSSSTGFVCVCILYSSLFRVCVCIPCRTQQPYEKKDSHSARYCFRVLKWCTTRFKLFAFSAINGHVRIQFFSKKRIHSKNGLHYRSDETMKCSCLCSCSCLCAVHRHSIKMLSPCVFFRSPIRSRFSLVAIILPILNGRIYNMLQRQSYIILLPIYNCMPHHQFELDKLKWVKKGQRMAATKHFLHAHNFVP